VKTSTKQRGNNMIVTYTHSHSTVMGRTQTLQRWIRNVVTQTTRSDYI